MYEVTIMTTKGPFIEVIEDITMLGDIINKYWDIYISMNMKKIKQQSRELKK